MSKAPKPTDAELAILRVLWANGPSTVREVHDAMADTRSVAYTTTLKTLQVMTEKGLTLREEQRGQHIYRPRLAEEETLRHLVVDLLDRAFSGSTSPSSTAIQHCWPAWLWIGLTCASPQQTTMIA